MPLTQCERFDVLRNNSHSARSDNRKVISYVYTQCVEDCDRTLEKYYSDNPRGSEATYVYGVWMYNCMYDLDACFRTCQ